MKAKSYLSLFIAQFGQQCAVASLQMCGAHANLFARFNDTQIGRNGHLIALDAPYFQNACIVINQFEFGFFVENRTAVGPVVFGDVQTRRVRLRIEDAIVIERR